MTELFEAIAAAIAKERYAAAPSALGTEAREQVERETAAVMCVVRPVAASVENLRGDVRGMRLQRDRLRLAWRSARRGRLAARREAADLAGHLEPYGECDPMCDCGDHQGARSCGCHVTGEEARTWLRQQEAEIDLLSWLRAEAMWQRDQFRANEVENAELANDIFMAAGAKLASAVVLPEDASAQIATTVHDALCMCQGAGTGITLRSRDWDLMFAALVPLLESWCPATVEATPACTCDATGAPEFPHRNWCELNHPHHQCDPRSCRFATVDVTQPVRDLAEFHTLSLTQDQAQAFDADVTSARGVVDRHVMDAIVIKAWAPWGPGSPVLQERRVRMATAAVDALISAGAVAQPMKITVTDGGDGGPGMRDINVAFARYMPENDPDVDREALLDVLKTADADYRSGYRPTAYLEHLADRLAAADVPTKSAEPLERAGHAATELDGAALIAAKRRAVIAKGFTAEHDDQHIHGELLEAARCYANQGRTWFPEHTYKYLADVPSMLDQGWPWWTAYDEPEGWHPSNDPVENLVNAGQLIAAEIGRLHRAAGTP